MSNREFVWRVLFGATAVLALIMGAVNVLHPWTALAWAFVGAVAAYLALDDAVREL